MNRLSAPGRAFDKRLVSVPLLLLVILSLFGCEELDARRKIQKAGKLYADGRFAQAAELYEEALKIKGSHQTVAHHNAGLTYSKMFKPGDESPENIQVANLCTEHFQKYLETDPGNTNIISLMTRIWMDSGQYEKALAFWEGELAKNPDDPDVLEILAGINRQAGNWEKSVEWYYKQADATHGVSNKVDTYLLIAKLIWHKLYRQQPIGFDRVRIADVGIGALQKAMTLNPPDELRMQLHAYMSSIFQFRALAHEPTWARQIDRASMRYHAQERKALNDKLQAEAKKEGGKATNGEQLPSDDESDESGKGEEPKDSETGLLESRLPATASG